MGQTTTETTRILERDQLPDPLVTDNAKRVLRRRYLAKDDEGNIIEDAKGMYIRIAEHLAEAEEDQVNQEVRAREFYNLMASNRFLPNSPTIMNAGRRLGMLSACFVLPVEDDLHDIMDSCKATALVQRAGGGTGYSFSALRPTGSVVASSGGTTSGPLAFIDMYSATTAAIQQGAFRRGANMAILDVSHPDVVDFINAKEDLSRWQNYNVSIAITDKFMKELPNDTVHRVGHSKWGTGYLAVKDGVVKAYRDGEAHDGSGWRYWTTQDTWNLICKRAHATGEPGLFFIDTANDGDPISHLGKITATNPCGEQPLHAYDSCNLGSINVSAYYCESEEDSFLWNTLEDDVHTAVRLLDNVITMNKYPLDEIRDMAHKTRRIGLGVMGVADLLFKRGVAYDSDEGREIAANLMMHIEETATQASYLLAQERGEYGAWQDGNPDAPAVRNSYRTTVAPTGSISIIADCSCGIEPIFALGFTRRVMQSDDGDYLEMTEYNKPFEEALLRSNLDEPTRMALKHSALESGSIQSVESRGVKEIDELKRVFKTAHDISWQDHVKMQAAFQCYVDSAVSKTINLGHDSTPDDVAEAYRMAHDLGCKGITVYRDGSRDGVAGMEQPMAVRPETTPAVEAAVDIPELDEEPKLPVTRLVQAPQFDPDFAPAVRTRIQTQWGHIHLTVVLDETQTREVEIFAQLGKAGDLVLADIEGLCRVASLYLRGGGDLEQVIKQWENIGSVHVGVPGPHGKISSVPDALAKCLRHYLSKKAGSTVLEAKDVAHSPVLSVPRDLFDSAYGAQCPSCKGRLAFQEGCKTCHACGYAAC